MFALADGLVKNAKFPLAMVFQQMKPPSVVPAEELANKSIRADVSQDGLGPVVKPQFVKDHALMDFVLDPILARAETVTKVLNVLILDAMTH